jgi:hypothetical protein
VLLPLFVLQVVLSIAAWGSIAAWLVVPYVRTQTRQRALLVLLIPQLFRHVGVTLLVPGVVAPGMPRSFAVPTAVGDTATQLLTVVALVCLHRGWRYAIPLVWMVNIFGLTDLVLNVVRAARTGAVAFLQAAWFGPTFIVPLMVVSHVLVFWVLLRREA